MIGQVPWSPLWQGLLTGIGWLIGGGAVVFLWQRPSSVFFRTAGLS